MARTVARAPWLWCSALALGCSSPVAQGLSEADANAVVVVLEENGIGTEKSPDPGREGAFRVSVPRGEEGRAVATLARHGLPKETAPGVLESLGPGSLVPSRAAEHAKLIAGTAGELERSLRGVDGVLGARVHLAVPAPDRLLPGQAVEAPSASVLLRHRGATPPLATADVQKLVAGAVPGLKEERVSVVTTPTAVGPPASERELARVGPLTVARGSLGALRWGLLLAVLTHLALLGALVVLWWKHRTLRTRLAGADAGAPR